MTSSLPFAALFLRLENFFWSAIRALYHVQVLNIVVVIPSLFAAAYLEMRTSRSPAFFPFIYVLFAHSTALSLSSQE